MQAACLLKALGIENLQTTNEYLRGSIKRLGFALSKSKIIRKRVKLQVKQMEKDLKSFMPLKRPAMNFYTIDSNLVEVVTTK